MAAYDDRDGVIWMDGKLVPWREANVHVLTHALHYASAVFEGERCYNGKIFKCDEHVERLHNSARLLDMEIPYSVDEIKDAQNEMLEANGWKDAYVRPLAFRCAGEEMGVSAKANPVRLIIAGWQWGAYYGDAKRTGARLDVASWRRPDPATIPCKAKAAGLYMICTMAKHAAQAKGCSDALFMDYRGFVAEATGANIFFTRGGEVHTPLPDCFLDGITRQAVIGLLKEKNITVHERHIMPTELADFEQCWLTGTAAEVTPVGQIGNFRFEVGDIVHDIADTFEEYVRA